jgi:cob(I)alamin adenosyltransferase
VSVSPRAPDEPVRLTRIYTRGGDKGETSLGDGSRVPKLDCRIGAYGAVDELNSLVGLALAAGPPEEVREVLARVQNELFDVGADLSVPYGVGDGRLRVDAAKIEQLEELCDQEVEINPLVLVYLNRLSDLLFILARTAAGGDAPLWKPGASS